MYESRIDVKEKAASEEHDVPATTTGTVLFLGNLYTAASPRLATYKSSVNGFTNICSALFI
jgi:hypothetical protein